jgi:hypothetical protein
MTDKEKLKLYCLKIKEKGRLKYSLINGAFFGVVICYIGGNLIDLFDTPFNEAFFSFISLKRIIIGLILGVLIYGTLVWNLYMRTLNRMDGAKD